MLEWLKPVLEIMPPAALGLLIVIWWLFQLVNKKEDRQREMVESINRITEQTIKLTVLVELMVRGERRA